MDHIVIDQEDLSFLMAPALEPDEVPVAETGDDGELGEELSAALNTIGVVVNAAFDGNESTGFRDDAFVDGAEGAVADDAGGVE